LGPLIEQAQTYVEQRDFLSLLMQSGFSQRVDHYSSPVEQHSVANVTAAFQ
jgi:hypothetical protein